MRNVIKGGNKTSLTSLGYESADQLHETHCSAIKSLSKLSQVEMTIVAKTDLKGKVIPSSKQSYRGLCLVSC